MKVQESKKSSFVDKILKTLMFWKKPKVCCQAAMLSDLWEPSEVLEQELKRRKEPKKYLGHLGFQEEKWDPVKEEELQHKTQKEAKKLQKLAAKMMKLANKGKIPLAEVLITAFPDLKDWKTPCPPKTEGLKPFTPIEVNEDEVAKLLDGLDNIPSISWTWKTQRLCSAVAAAIVLFQKGGDETDALTVLSGNCEPLLQEALKFSKLMGTMAAPESWHAELIRFTELSLADPRWKEMEKEIKEYKEQRERERKEEKERHEAWKKEKQLLFGDKNDNP